MSWSTTTVSDQRLAFVHLVRTEGWTVAAAAKRFAVSRKTGHKWLARHALDPEAPLADRSRAPVHRPARTDTSVEDAIVRLRRQTGWGARKLRADLLSRGAAVPCVRAVHDVLRRHGLIAPPQPEPDAAPGRFEREHPNDLWQLDHKKAGEVDRRPVVQLTVLDDHARFLLLLETMPDLSMPPAWEALWGLFGRVGMPAAVLCDNAFSTRSPIRTLSWFDSRLVRAGITPLHGRAYHPQTQGKVERLHGTLERECYPRTRRDRITHFHADCERWRTLYNNRRPHEALGDKPPITRWTPSPRPRPTRLPKVEYPHGIITRRVCAGGIMQYKRYRFTAGAGLAGEHVAVEELDGHIALRYGHFTFRRIRNDLLTTDHVL
jgi:transposase InsO family protein